MSPAEARRSGQHESRAAPAEPGCGGVSGAPGPVVSGEALIEGIGPRGRIAGGVSIERAY